MSELDDLDAIYETARAVSSPCHPNQSRVRRQYALNRRLNSADPLRRQLQGQRHRKKPPITLAKLNLPD